MVPSKSVPGRLGPFLSLLAAGALLSGSPSLRAAESPRDRAGAGLAKAAAFMRSISTEGGYLWWYSEDLKERSGEVKATPTQVWVQPPGTPSVGMLLLRAYRITREPQYLEGARAAVLALARGQLESGGWDYLIDFDPAEGGKWYRRTDRGHVPEAEARRRRNVTTFDDDNTQSALRFLAAFVDETKGEAAADAREALEYGLSKMLEAQYPNGAWPQRYAGTPPDPAAHPVRPARIPETYPREYGKEDYRGHYTLNDNTQRDCIRTMLDAYHRFGKQQYLQAAKKGGDFLILAQLPAPQSAWAQQYNPAMEPAWARAFEPPAVCTSESAGAVRILVDLYREMGDEKYLKPIPAAIDWFHRSEIAPGTWARLYELATNRPIYGDRDGRIHYTLEELSEERRKGYSWRGAYGIPETIAYYEAARKPRGEAKQPAAKKREGLEQEALKAVAALDAQGRWVTDGRIQTRVFIRNADALCDYLEAGPQAGK